MFCSFERVNSVTFLPVECGSLDPISGSNNRNQVLYCGCC